MKDERTVALISITAGIVLFALNYLYLNSQLLVIASAIFAFGIPLSIEYLKYKEIREIEEKLPDFLTDVSESMKAGMTLPQALHSSKKNDYGVLSKHVKQMAVKIDWGVPFDKIIEDFAKVGGTTVKRVTTAIVEAYDSGGDVSKVLDSVVNAMYDIEKIRKERQAEVYSQLLTGYVIFFVFLGVLVSLKGFLVPSLSTLGTGGKDVTALYSGTLFYLILIQGFFSGIVIGKLSEGRMRAGLKHSLILVLVGYLAFALF
ncbi:MAG TPA: type II secretion system F family protein [archaeon]|nr:type II secretion system F family protein [archaeon]